MLLLIHYKSLKKRSTLRKSTIVVIINDMINLIQKPILYIISSYILN